MQVLEAKEIIKSMELRAESRKNLLGLLAGMKDEDELPNEILDQILMVVDQEPEAEAAKEEIDESLAYIDKPTN